MKKLLSLILVLTMVFALAACGGAKEEKAETAEKTPVNVFAAASLSAVMADFEASYEMANPNIDIVVNADSSGTLLTQIQEGAPCDIFFSAAQKQVKALEEGGQLIDGTKKNVLNNRLVVVTRKDSNTAVTGLADIAKASSIALADGSVPAGKYTRTAMIALGLIAEAEDPAAITTQEISDQLGGVEISEQGNVSKVLAAVAEASCEVGTTYLSDTVGHEDDIKVLEIVGNDLTGDIIYPAARVINPDATDAITAAADDFFAYITNDAAAELYTKYGFDIFKG